MNKSISIRMAILLGAVLSFGVGCDLGTYQTRAKEPIPQNTRRAGDVGNPTQSDAQDQADSGNGQ